MFENFEIFGVAVQPVYIAVIMSLLISYLLIWESDAKKSLYVLWLKTLVIFFVIYKVSFLIFNPGDFNNLLYANGGTEGLLLGLVISYAYLGYKTDRLYYIESFIFWAMSFLVFYNFLELQTITQWPYLTMTLITLAGIILMYFLSKHFRRVVVVFIGTIIIQLVIRVFVYNGEMVFGLSSIEWWLLISLLYVIVMTFRGLKNEIGETTE